MGSKASPASLGKQIATFHGRPIQLPTWVLLFLPGGLIVAFCFAYGTYLAADTYQQYGPVMAIMRSQSWLLLGTILLILLSAYLIYCVLVALQRIRVFEGGLQLRSFFLRSRSYRWSEISGIASSATMLTFFGRELRTVPRGTIYTWQGRRINLSNQLVGLPRLVKIAKSRIYPLLWPQVKSAFDSGKPVQFGRVKVSQEEMTISNRSIPWSEIIRIYTAGGYLVVELHDNSSRKVPTIDIPNLELLLKVVDWGD